MPHLHKHTHSHLHLHRQTHTHTHTHKRKFIHSQTHIQAYMDMHKKIMNMFDWGLFGAACKDRGGGQELSAQVIRAELN